MFASPTRRSAFASALLVALAVPWAVAAREPAPANGRLDRHLITNAVNAKLMAVQGCAEASLARHGGSVPKVLVRFVIGDTGRVTAAEISGTPPADAMYGACLLDVVRTLKTPPPRGGPVTVTYPFLICGVGY